MIRLWISGDVTDFIFDVALMASVWVLVLSAYLGVGGCCLVVGPASRLQKFEAKRLRAQNPHTPAWKFHAFSAVVGVCIVLLWPVLAAIAWRHEAALGRAPNPKLAAELAHKELLAEVMDLNLVREVANKLAYGGVNYSTHELATATALSLYRQTNADECRALSAVQLSARLTVVDWVQQRKVRDLFAITFEETLYKLFAQHTNMDPRL